MADRYHTYPEYKDSGAEWLGDIPSHWQVMQLKRTVEGCVNGIWGAEPNNDGNDTIVLRVADFDRSRLLVKDDGYTYRNIEEKEKAGRLLKHGDLLLEKSGGGEKTLVGQVVLFDKRVEAVTSNFVAKLSPVTGFDSRYLNYVFSRFYGDNINYCSIKQNTGIQNLDSSSYLAEQFGFPAKDEQSQIAAFLDHETAKIDTLIEKQQQLITLLKEKRQAVISHAVTKGLNPDAPMRDSGIDWLGEVPAHWELTRLGWITTEINDINHEMPAAVDEGVPFISAKDLLNDGSLNFTHDVKKISEEDFIRLSAKICPRRNDIIYSRIGAALGKARLVETDMKFLVSYSCCVVRVIEERANPLYVSLLLDTDLVLTEAKGRTVGIGVPDLGLKEIARFPVPLPPKEEQINIENYLLENTFKFTKAIESCLEGVRLLQERRTALISAAATGKIDVRSWVAPQQQQQQNENNKEEAA